MIAEGYRQPRSAVRKWLNRAAAFLVLRRTSVAKAVEYQSRFDNQSKFRAAVRLLKQGVISE